MKLFIIFLAYALSASCGSQGNKSNTDQTNDSASSGVELQIGEYVTSAYEDSKGNLWFGTLQKGIAKFDGQELTYMSSIEGLPSDRVTGVTEDSNGMYWFTTGAGLSKYDGKSFTNISVGDDFGSNSVSTIMIDSKGTFWVGTWGGVYTFDGEEFYPFPIPYPSVETAINPDTKDWITSITEDPEGNIWFARDGYGMSKYDGNTFTYILKKDGIFSNNVTEIVFEKNGDMWIGTRVAEKDHPDPKMRTGKGGVNKMTNDTIIAFPEIEGINNADVYTIHKDRSDNIWMSTIENGVYRYDGTAFTNFDVPVAIMGMMDDSKGNMWLCGAGGLYRINQNGEVVNITTNGPWR